MAWRCSECACTREQAERKRRRLGLRRLRVGAVTCGLPACSRERERRRMHEKYGRGSGRRYPVPASWRCEVCGVGPEPAQRRRERRKLSALRPTSRTCSPECARDLRFMLPERPKRRTRAAS